MSYYGMGDYYRGDYYRGDPGLLSSIGSGIRAVAGAILKRTPVGMGIGAVGSLIPRQGLPAPRSGGGLVFPGGIGVNPTRILPGGQPFITRQGGATRAGYHLNKGGKNPGTYEVRNRSMNPANPRALRRAVRRERGFVALARRVLKGTGLKISRRGMGAGKKKGRR